jgi:hypothetical protein
MYPKWYSLYLVHPNGDVEEIEFPDGYVDHVPDPMAVAAYAESHDYEVDSLAYEMMVGRWETEVRGNYE